MRRRFTPIEKEFLIELFRTTRDVPLKAFCAANDISESAFNKWIKLYDEGGIEALDEAGPKCFGKPGMLPEGVEENPENFKREILKLRIENERLKKNYAVKISESGQKEFIRLKAKNSES